MFFCCNLEYKPYTEFVTEKFEKRDLIKSQGRDLFQILAKKSDYQSTVVTLKRI